MTGRKLSRIELLKTLNKLYQKPHLRKLAAEIGIDEKLYEQAFKSFQKFCVENNPLPAELHIVFSDILGGHSSVDELYQPFVKHARSIFPHLDCIDELKKISDLRLPPNWYPEARAIQRKIIFHCGPTNSGKTYHALDRFLTASSGVYCGPLKLLAMEVHAKANQRGTPCDLVTGEERRIVNPEGSPSPHVACTVEMVNIKDSCEVAVIDEIQMVRDTQRGWAWTRALLGIPAKEVHICGEAAALDVIKSIILPIGDEVEVRRYERLTKLRIEDESINSLENIKPGDCIVCFNKNDLFSLVLDLEKIGKHVGVIYGGLPPLTKINQAKKFNDPQDDCKILVATDAIGMGLNLSIKRVIFQSIEKVHIDEKGNMSKGIISVSQALQIAGRAGRYNTEYETGYVTTMKKEDLSILRRILSTPVEPIPAVGLQPTADQIELFSYYLPNASLSNLVDIFISLCEMNTSNYFMCDMGSFKSLAEMIQHISLPLRARYVFCCAPINLNYSFACTMFTQFAHKYSINEPVTIDWICESIGWPLPPPRSLANLQHLEVVFDVLELYLWLSYRFPDLFPDGESVRKIQGGLDSTIHQGLVEIAKLITTTINSKFASDGKLVQYRQSMSSPYVLEDEVLSLYKDNKKRVDKTLKPDGGYSSNKSLTEQLVESGMLTPELIKKLHSEWSKNEAKRGPTIPPNKRNKKS